MMRNHKDIIAGAFFVIVGAAFAIHALANLKIGTASRMGGGYFPTMLGLIMIGLGLTIALTSRHGIDGHSRPLPWRAIAALTLAPVLFGLTVHGFGLVPASILCVAVACAASDRMTLPMAVALTLGLTAFCVLVFSYGLGLPLALFSLRPLG